MNEKKYNVLDSPLQDISSNLVRLSDDDKKIYNEHLGQVLDCIIQHMKKNGVFKCLYRSNVYTGSFYENLRVSKPDEFDINLIFVLPATCKIVYDKKQPGFVRIKVDSLDESQIKKSLNDAPSLERILTSWIDKKTGYLQRTGFMQWMQGVFTKALDEVSLENTVIKRSASGPAFTIKVSKPTLGLSEYSVDLVPVFEFPDKDLPAAPVRKLPKGTLHKEWTVVPKPPPDVTDPTYWRMSFYKQEKEIMNNLYGMKHIIKLIKLFREKENWKVLSSYAIKTVFLWECEQQPKQDFWQNSIGQLFVHMLRRLSDYFNKQSISFYWDKNLNLLSKVKEDTLKIMSNRIVVVLKQIDLHLDDDPKLVKKFFGCNQKEMHDNNSHKSNPISGEFKKLHIQQSSITKNNKSISSLSTTRDQNQFPIEMPEIRKSSVTVTNLIDLEEPDWHSPKSEEKINTVIQFRNEHSDNQIHKTNKISDSVVDILSMILKEQHEIKQCLKYLIQQHGEIKRQIQELQEETAHMRKLFWKNLYDTSISQSSATSPSLLDLQPSNNQKPYLSGSLQSACELKCSPALYEQGKNRSVAIRNTNSSHFSELLDIFTT